MSKVLTTRQLAERLGIPQKEVVRRIRIGDINARKLDWIWIVDADEISVIKASDWYKRQKVAAA